MAIYSLHNVRSWLVDVSVHILITMILPLTFSLQHQILPSRLLKFVNDFERFVLRFFGVIKESAMHIYHSALPWCPMSSLTRQMYERQMISEVKLVNAIDVHWDACLRTIPLDGEATGRILFSPKGSALAIPSSSGVEIFEATTGVATFQIEDCIRSITFSPDDDMLVCGGWDGIIRVWDVQTSYLVRSFEGHGEEICSVAFSPLGDMIVSGSADETVRIWDISSDCCKCVLEGHEDEVFAVCWSGTGDRVISGSWDCSVRVWDVSRQECLMILRGHTREVTSVASSCDSSLIASGSYDRTVQVYGAQSGNVLQTISVDDWVHSVQFSTNDDNVFYTNGRSATIWDLSKKEKVSTIKHGGRWSTFSRDGTRVSSTEGNSLKIWTTESGYSNYEKVSHRSKEILHVTFVPDGRLMTSRSREDSKVWDTTLGDYLFTCGTHSLQSIVFSPDSAFVAYLPIGDSYMEVWDANTCCLVNVTRSDSDIEMDLGDFALSPCGGRLVSRLSSHITLWDLKSGERLAYLDIDFPIPWRSRITFAVDGTSVFIRNHNDDKITQRWHISLAPLSNRYDSNITEFTSLPLVFIPMQDESPYEVTSVSRQRCRFDDYNQKWDWILDEDGKHLLWLPQDRRCSSRNRCGFHGKKIAIRTNNSRVYVADFSDALQ
jgi:WD40 repeat protein